MRRIVGTEFLQGNKARRMIGVFLAITMVGTLVANPSADALGGVDNWTSTVTLTTPNGWFAQPVHGTLMPDGRVMFFGMQREAWPPTANDEIKGHAFIFDPDPVGAALPGQIVTNEIAEPVQLTDWNNGAGISVWDDLTCAGHTLTADGKLFTAGGTRVYTDGTNFVYRGLPTQTLFDGFSWNRVADMTTQSTLDRAYRWYPTTTRLPDTRILITAGFEQVTPDPAVNLTTEVFDPATGVNTTASSYGQTPVELWQSDYTHVWVLPYTNIFYDILMIGEKGVPALNSTASLSSWEVRDDQLRPGATGGGETNNGTSSVMLPLRLTNGEHGYANGAVMLVGGGKGTTFIDQADIYDPVLQHWTESINLGTPRHHPDTVLLPDGRVLIVAGHNAVGDPGVLQAQYIDPQNDFVVTQGSSIAQQTRGYHSVALLLPDGRVLVAGGRDSVTSTSEEKPSYQYYEPDYMTQVRPEIVSVSSTQLGYQSDFDVTTSGAAPTEAVLVALGSMTHSFDMNQRMIQLAISVEEVTETEHIATITTPPDTNVAAPGDYMLFVLDENRIPSMAKIVRLV